jgi:hypothetical protein
MLDQRWLRPSNSTATPESLFLALLARKLGQACWICHEAQEAHNKCLIGLQNKIAESDKLAGAAIVYKLSEVLSWFHGQEAIHVSGIACQAKAGCNNAYHGISYGWIESCAFDGLVMILGINLNSRSLVQRRFQYKLNSSCRHC